MDECENKGIDYDIWNAEDMFMGLGTDVELGLTEEDWNKLGY